MAAHVEWSPRGRAPVPECGTARSCPRLRAGSQMGCHRSKVPIGSGLGYAHLSSHVRVCRVMSVPPTDLATVRPQRDATVSRHIDPDRVPEDSVGCSSRRLSGLGSVRAGVCVVFDPFEGLGQCGRVALGES